MKIVVPMAGRGLRFSEIGITTPKPMIDVLGQPMLSWAMKSLEGLSYSKIVFIVLREHDDVHRISEFLVNRYGALAEVIVLDTVTEGQLATVMSARDLIDDDEDVLIGNCDTYVVSNLAHDIASRPQDCAGMISTAELAGDRWSFAKIDEQDWVTSVAEKVRISDQASTGLYYFSHGNQLVNAADEIFRKGEKIRGEYYVIGAYQKYLERSWRVKISRATEMWDMGTPESLTRFQLHFASLHGLV